MTQPLLPMAFSEYGEPVPTADQVSTILALLPVEFGNGLREKLNDVLKARAPGPFCDALGDLEAYLSTLDDSRLMPFENQIALKTYVMLGWREWRASFNTFEAL
ncbi:hypothetical protein FGA82_17130 [Pseudomonas fluorescens]|uniref:hypothetical protein n=1 Tax=Pseudomonas fluorescens TaxID=294 RepID=UPI001130C4F3|nr:hypothetical protein [Pseudomonas fluorescens]TMU77622.1 hypothetical protein FGA82_17130 [Pseudomonas fluorescens]